MKLTAPVVREVATAGDPVRAVVDATAQLASGLYHVSVAHDDGCPVTAERKTLRHCTCELLSISVRRRRS